MVLETGTWLNPNDHGSISRCLGYDRLDPQVFILTEAVTPKKPNDCGFIQPNFTSSNYNKHKINTRYFIILTI